MIREFSTIDYQEFKGYLKMFLGQSRDCCQSCFGHRSSPQLPPYEIIFTLTVPEDQLMRNEIQVVLPMENGEMHHIQKQSHLLEDWVD